MEEKKKKATPLKRDSHAQLASPQSVGDHSENSIDEPEADLTSGSISPAMHTSNPDETVSMTIPKPVPGRLGAIVIGAEPVVYRMSSTKKGTKHENGDVTIDDRCEVEFPSGTVPGAPVTYWKASEYWVSNGWEDYNEISIELSRGTMISFADSKAVIELEDRIQGDGGGSYSGSEETTWKVLPAERKALELERKYRHELKKGTFSDHFWRPSTGLPWRIWRDSASEFFDKAFPPCIIITIAHFDISDGLLNITAQKMSGEKFLVAIPTTASPASPRVKEVVPEISKAGGYPADSRLRLVLPDGAVLKAEDAWPA